MNFKHFQGTCLMLIGKINSRRFKNISINSADSSLRNTQKKAFLGTSICISSDIHLFDEQTAKINQASLQENASVSRGQVCCALNRTQ